jgi:hypothetical protein
MRLASWFDSIGAAAFLETNVQKAPYAGAGAAADTVPLFQWDTLARVLASDRALDLVTVQSGRLVPAPVPRSLADVRGLMRRGISVVVRASEQHDAGLAELAAAFGRTLPGEAHVQLYVTPGTTHSYGWHYDFEDVFIVQTAGVKDYYFRANTVARETLLGERLDFSRFRAETSQIYSARLLAGDWLYIPSTWWHLVTCAEDALSISVGVMPPDAVKNARRIPAGWSGRGRAPDRAPPPAAPGIAGVDGYVGFMANTDKESSPPAKDSASKGHDSHGHPFKRVSGPGPNDQGKGAAGPEAIERLAGGPERTPSGSADQDGEEGEEVETGQDGESGAGPDGAGGGKATGARGGGGGKSR